MNPLLINSAKATESRMRAVLKQLILQNLGIEGSDGPRGQLQGGPGGDVIVQSIDGSNLAEMWSLFQQTIDIQNSTRDPLISMMTYNVTNPTERILYPISEDFEQATERGLPRNIRNGVPFILGFDFQWYDLGIGFTWQFLLDASSDQITALHNSALEADNRLQFTKIFKRIFNNNNTSGTQGTTLMNGVTFVAHPFWNADGMAPPPYKNNVFDGTHTHYFTTGDTTIASADVKAIEDTLYHHGIRVNLGYTMLMLVNRQEGTTLRTLRTVNGAEYDFIPAPGVGGGVFLPASLGIEGRPSVVNVPGLQVIGTYGPFVIVEEDYIPPGYVLALASGGALNLNNPIGIRQHPNSQGLKLIGGDSDDYPMTNSFYRRGMGTGVRQRSAGVVMQVTSSGSYSIPAAYV